MPRYCPLWQTAQDQGWGVPPARAPHRGRFWLPATVDWGNSANKRRPLRGRLVKSHTEHIESAPPLSGHRQTRRQAREAPQGALAFFDSRAAFEPEARKPARLRTSGSWH